MIGNLIKYVYDNLGNYNTNFIWIEPFDSFTYLLFQLLSFGVILLSSFVNSKRKFSINNNLYKIAFGNILLNSVISIFNIPLGTNILIMIIFLLL